MDEITTISYRGHCPRCSIEQNDTDPTRVDVVCWGCSVNANVERNDIKRDIEAAIKSSNSISKIGLRIALEIVKTYDR